MVDPRIRQIAHNLGSPIAVILAYSKLAQAGNLEEPEAIDLGQSAQYVFELVRELRTIILMDETDTT